MCQKAMRCVGPNNIRGLVITGEGETFIQEANDYGYHLGGMQALKKSYQLAS